MDASKSDSHRFLFLAQLLCFKARAVTLLVCVGTIRVFKALMTKTKKKLLLNEKNCLLQR